MSWCSEAGHFLPYKALGNFPASPYFCPTSPLMTKHAPPVLALLICSVLVLKLNDKPTSNSTQCHFVVLFSIQIDGSVNKQAEDNKFVSARLVYPDSSLHTIFLAISTPQERGAKGLLEAVNVALNICGDYSNKLIGITTDGESANTGKSGGLGKLLSDQCKRQILTFRCCAYRSDLAAEAIIAAVPELQIWKTNLMAVASYFRRSALRTKLLHEIIPDARAFPKHHEVRFAQHQVQLIDAVLHNMNGCKQVWQSLSTNGDRKDKAEACGLLKTWNEKQLWMTTVMGD